MRTFDVNLAAPGRLMLAAGLVGFGLVSLLFDHALDGLEPFELQPPAVWLNSGVLLASGVGLFWSQTAPRVGLALWVLLTLLFFVHTPGLVAEPDNAARWVSALEVLGLLAACMMIAAPDRADCRLVARVGVGLMLILFGAVHWMHREAIAGMIPEWMPGRELWPWVTGAANVTACLALVSGVLAKAAAALAGAMFASWIVLVHLPRLLAAPGDRGEWVAAALAFALTGVVWTLQGALSRNGEDLQPSLR